MSHLRNDIALMRLVKPVQLGPKVGTVCFPRKNTRVATGTKCWISGLSSLIKETGCLFLEIDSNSISVIILYWPVRKNCWDWGRGWDSATFYPRTIAFYVSEGGEADLEEPDCSVFSVILVRSDKSLLLNFNPRKYIGRRRKTCPSFSISIRTQRAQAQQESCVWSGAHQMEPPSPLISWVNPFPSRFINRTAFFPRKVSYFRESLIKLDKVELRSLSFDRFPFLLYVHFYDFTAAGIWVSWNKS